MTRNTNNNSDQVDDKLHEELLYELLLCKKKDIIAIQKKLGMDSDRKKGPIENRNQIALNQSKKGKTLEDSFGLLFDLVGKLINIRGDLDMTCQPILTILYENIQDLEEGTFRKMLFEILYHLLLYLEEKISVIQNDLSIVSYTNSEISGLKADKNARAYFQKFRRSFKRCSKCENTENHR
jgi:hypothetical protein